jgi:hypothetical protein
MSPARCFGWTLFLATLLVDLDTGLTIAALVCLKTLWSKHHGRRRFRQAHQG